MKLAVGDLWPIDFGAVVMPERHVTAAGNTRGSSDFGLALGSVVLCPWSPLPVLELCAGGEVGVLHSDPTGFVEVPVRGPVGNRCRLDVLIGKSARVPSLTSWDLALPRPVSQRPLEVGRPDPMAGTHRHTFGEVFEAYAGYVLALLRRLGVRAGDVEDVAQEVCVVVHTQLNAFEGRSTLKTWICGISLRKASEYRRKAYRRRETSALSDEPALHPEQERALEQSQRSAQLRQALTRLPEAQLQVFVLFEIEELSMVEVARAVGCPRFTAYTRLYAARRAVRAYFEEQSR